jgi:hypothetical protein
VVGCMTCCVDYLRPKSIQGLIVIKHGSCYLYKSVILSFCYSILLRSIESQKLMLDAFFV